MLRTLHEDHGTLWIGDYIRRARQERELAVRASSCQGAKAHLKLAHYYEALVASANIVPDKGNAADQDHGCLGLLTRSMGQSLGEARIVS